MKHTKYSRCLAQSAAVSSPVEDDVVMALLSGQFVGGGHSSDGQQRFEKDRQTIVDRIRHFNVFITPATKNRASQVVCFTQHTSVQHAIIALILFIFSFNVPWKTTSITCAANPNYTWFLKPLLDFAITGRNDKSVTYLFVQQWH